MKVKLSRKAEADLEAIADWIAKDDPNMAWRFSVQLRAECTSLQDMSQRHPVFSKKQGEVIHRKVYGQYLIFYIILSDRVEIVRIFHGAQDYLRFLN